jgi:hypothetical protein
MVTSLPCGLVRIADAGRVSEGKQPQLNAKKNNHRDRVGEIATTVDCDGNLSEKCALGKC